MGSYPLLFPNDDDPRDEALRRVIELGESWVGFETTHDFGDAVLVAIGPEVLNMMNEAFSE